MTTWKDIKKIAKETLVKKYKLKEYIERLRFEFKQIELQGAGDYWVDIYEKNQRTETNKNGLVLPLLLGLTNIDPIKEGIEHNIQYHPDYPDIDIDFLPIARDYIKQYAADTYGSDKVCSVGLWQSYKPRLAILDSLRTLDISPEAKARFGDAQQLTKTLPDEFDDMGYEEACEAYPEFKKFAEANKEIVSMAYRLVKLLKARGRHAGGLIISSVPVREHIPLFKSGGQWTSAWTEGRSTQLSKFGFVKFDILGLTNLLHIWNCKKLVEKNKGVRIDWQDMDVEDDRAGWEILADGTKHKITFSDDLAIKMAHERKVETIFQFETDLAKSILQKGGVKSFGDLVIYTSLGRPGPLPLVDMYVARRDGKTVDGVDHSKWREKEDPRIVEMLEDTYGIIVFQEQLSRFFVDLCGFTIPEAEAARKAVAKKWADKLAKIKDKMIAGATKTIGRERAIEWWGKIESFARYCFNRSHALAYIIISYRCLWLKAHYPAEWWASVMSNCKREKMIKYMGIARAEDVEFGTLDFNKMTQAFDVEGDKILIGIESIKGIGTKSATKIAGIRDCANIDELVKQTGKDKIAYERLIKLGAFDRVHPNRRALWHWYLYKHGQCQDSRRIKAEVHEKLAWSEEDVEAERQKKIKAYFKEYPRRKKIPPKLANWKPKLSATMQQLEEMYDDYELFRKLEFEKAYFGYYWTSPLSLYYSNGHDIEDAKISGTLEAIIEGVEVRSGANGPVLQLSVTDGVGIARLMVWNNEWSASDYDVSDGEAETKFLSEGRGIKARVRWKDKYSSFSVAPGSIIMPLEMKDVSTN
jgi:DNA polymerase-3 subunit alpha